MFVKKAGWAKKKVIEQFMRLPGSRTIAFGISNTLLSNPSFYYLVEKWYLLIKPEWFFSSDGYKENYYSFEKVDWLKKQEKNVHVYNHFRFLVHFLKHDEPSTLFKQVKPYQFLSFGDPVIFSSALELVDIEWNPPKRQK